MRVRKSRGGALLSTRDEVELAREALSLITSNWRTQAMHVAAKLNLADLLAERPRSPLDLASATNTNAQALRRLLAALCSIGICTEEDDGSFAITPLGRTLSSDARCSVKSWALFWGASGYATWTQLLYSVQTGKSGRERLTGKGGFDHLTGDPEMAALFNQGMVELTRLTGMEVPRAYDFTGKRVMDVGGGYGALLAEILATYPTATGVLFDMDHAISTARTRFQARGLADRCEFVSGDFFTSIPAGADVYCMKSVIHDWNDEDAARILRTCRKAMTGSTRLLLIERVMPERLENGPEDQVFAQADLHMLVALAALERTEAQYAALLQTAGLKLLRAIRTASAFQILEAGAT
jgi:SAM-dependent methyltransferase/predicted transcriptional regulator